MQFDIRFDLSGRGVDLLGFFVGPHGSAELLADIRVIYIYTPSIREYLTRTSGFNSVTVGRTSSIAILSQYIKTLLQDRKSHTGAICFVDDNIPVLERIGNSPDQTLGSFRGRVDSDKTKGSFGVGHGEDE